MIWTEERIKSYLEGTFTRLHYDGRIVTEFVDLDFIPTHTPARAGRERGHKAMYHVWTDDDDTFLRELRNKGIPRHKIAEIMDRSEESIRRRIARHKQMVTDAVLL